MKPNSWMVRLSYAAGLTGLIAVGHWYHDQQVTPLYRPFVAADTTTTPVCGSHDPDCINRLMAAIRTRAAEDQPDPAPIEVQP